jgi:valyl-tRNA synthetase
MTKYLDRYEYGLAKIAFEEFFWADFCDNYLEMIKVRTYKPELFENGEAKKLAAQWTLFDVFYQIIQIITPYLPHITEEIYQDYFKNFFPEISLHITNYPTIDSFAGMSLGSTEVIDKEFEQVKKIVDEVRKEKTAQQVSL